MQRWWEVVGCASSDVQEWDGELADADGLFLSAIPAIVNGGKTFRLSGLSAQNSDRHSEAMLCCRVVIADVIKQ